MDNKHAKAGGVDAISDEEGRVQLVQFEDEFNKISTSGIIDNYFNLGEIKKRTTRRKSKAGRLSDREEEDERENENPDERAECDLEKLRDWLQMADEHLPKEVKEKNEALNECFHMWLVYLSAGFNLLLYGIGSKRAILRSFCEKALSEYTHLIVDAFHSTVTTRVILQACLETNLNLKNRSKSGTTLEWASNVAAAIEKRNEDVVLVINNIDGPDMRESAQQLALMELARCRRLHIVASFDHFNAPLLWNQEMLNAFNFLYVNVNTMLAYREEILAGDSKLLGLNTKTSGRAHTQASLDAVWASLTFNSRMVLYKVARVFYSTKDPVEFFDLFRQAREDFLVSSETALRQQLAELDDHRLIINKRHQDGNEYIRMNVDQKVRIRS
ncbi:unnamed protein product [Toxocara canis]|uniref:Origin recognition complex subunit 2 n=1 Tax=Toxocara canis TaxID=6265 RepID=A0A183UHD9_TOXCA|nr:unnamed protein product [Toxocara canis]